uniref:Uncharacterized protein n=1 Tax=uncultured Desulfobacterium sp. TaxID=201089 RepID=E1YMR4_9BACT|nr:unknown protein [uncultured Desulfobacterium sp.]
MATEKTSPLRNTCHGIVTVETNLPITIAPKDRVPRFIKILQIFSSCFGVNSIYLTIAWNKKGVNTIFNREE